MSVMKEEDDNNVEEENNNDINDNNNVNDDDNIKNDGIENAGEKIKKEEETDE
ncbi:MAG: hypothetical protein M1824_004300 [Vezdaea acicularis]|nr:MAG: hypothetical protein M1824_004300 [Vezdaea acicularis]